MIAARARKPAAQAALLAARRVFHSSPAACSSVPATAVATQKPKGFLASLLGTPPPALPPMYEALPGVAIPPPLTDLTAGKTEVTTLANGLKIASENLPGPTSTIGLFIDSGSIYESPMTSGTSQLLERMAFKSTANRTHFRLIREVEAIGANIVSSASREQMSYSADVIRTFVPEALEILVDSVRNSLFNEWEVKEQADRIREEAASLKPESFLLEAIHSAAYAGALGQPLMVNPAALSRLSGQLLFDFVAENYTAPRIVLSAAGVDHSDLVAAAEPLLSDLPVVAAPPPPASQYVGGDWRMAADSPLTHVVLAFEFPGGWRNEKEAAAVVVLQSLLGGGGSFSSGGPGKGMYSRLYTRVLNKYAEVEMCSAFNSIYNNTGIVGVYGTTTSHFVPSLVDILTRELLSVASPQGVTEDELSRAKNATISSVAMNLESRVVIAEDIGRQILTYGHRKSSADFINSVNAVTVKDIVEVSKKILKTPLSLAAYGDVVHVPRFDQIASRFN